MFRFVIGSGIVYTQLGKGNRPGNVIREYVQKVHV